MGGAAFTDDIPVAALEIPAAQLTFNGKVIYEATARVQLAWELNYAAGINRYLYNATTAQAFDAACSAGQTAYGNPASTDTDYLSAIAAIKAAIAEFVPAKISGPSALYIANGKMSTLTVTYDGDGTLSSQWAQQSTALTVIPVSALSWNIFRQGTGSAILQVYVVEAPDVIYGVAVT